MSQTTYDFAILGDSQPEGLLVAAGLARKGFSVLVVSSGSLGEMPPEENFDCVLPSKLGDRKLNDLLFRAGFFRLEEAGLVPSQAQNQVILPRYRLTFDGSSEQFLKELEREFPQAVPIFRKIFAVTKTNSSEFKRAVGELETLCRHDRALRRWIEIEIESALRPLRHSGFASLLREWIVFLLNRDGKIYRVDPKLKNPFHRFLLEHARKWGVAVCTEPIDLKPSWNSYHLTNGVKASRLLLNGIGGGRTLTRAQNPNWTERHLSWLYIDEIDVPLSSVPEPLQEFAVLEREGADEPSFYWLRLVVDRLRDEAKIYFGIWLPFHDSKSWLSMIEQGRQALTKLIPFLPESPFRPLPTLLELTEARGDCIKRGQYERLYVDELPPTLWKKIAGRFSVFPKRSSRLSRRVYSLSPHYLPHRNRWESFEESLKFLDHFENRRKRLRRDA